MSIFILPLASFRTSHHFVSCRNKGRNNISLARVKTIQPLPTPPPKKTHILLNYTTSTVGIYSTDIYVTWFFLHISLFFLYWLHARLERRKNRNVLVLLFEFIQLSESFLPLCLSMKLSRAVNNFKLLLSYWLAEWTSPACFPLLFPLVTIKSPSPLGHLPGTAYSQDITREQRQRDRSTITVHPVTDFWSFFYSSLVCTQ